MKIVVEKDGAIDFGVETGTFGGGRFLRIYGQKFFDTDGTCDTCASMFRAAEIGNTPINHQQLAAQLRGELAVVTPDIIATMKPLLPKGEYRVGLLRICPRIVFGERKTSSDCDDSRDGETPSSQTPVWWLGRSRRRECVVGDFVQCDENGSANVYPNIKNVVESEVILSHRSWEGFDQQRINEFSRCHRNLRGRIPFTAMALSIVESRTYDGGTTPHRRLTHFLLDGHHKTAAVSWRTSEPMQLLSFLSLTHSEADIKSSLTIRDWREFNGKSPFSHLSIV